MPSLKRPNDPPEALKAQAADESGVEVTSGSDNSGEAVQGDMLKPSAVNTPWVRVVAVRT